MRRGGITLCISKSCSRCYGVYICCCELLFLLLRTALSGIQGFVCTGVGWHLVRRRWGRVDAMGGVWSISGRILCWCMFIFTATIRSNAKDSCLSVNDQRKRSADLSKGAADSAATKSLDKNKLRAKRSLFSHTVVAFLVY
eukprot:scaffold409_cov167-Ochromonas_danica.AAC.3